ncbi:SMI1/KNR4 family protein [Drancourtella massiliensis]
MQNAEKLLGVKFSNQFWDFNAKYGYLSFYGNEIFGADPDHLDEMEGNRVLC